MGSIQGRDGHYSIHELADEFKVTPRAIRYYEEVGLLRPLLRDGVTQPRRFTARERTRLRLILRGKRLGFDLAEIREMLDLYDADPTGQLQCERVIAYGDQRVQDIEHRIAELEALRDEILQWRRRIIGEE